MDRITKIVFAASFIPSIISLTKTGFSLLTLLFLIIPLAIYMTDRFPFGKKEDKEE